LLVALRSTPGLGSWLKKLNFGDGDPFEPKPADHKAVPAAFPPRLYNPEKSFVTVAKTGRNCWCVLGRSVKAHRRTTEVRLGQLIVAASVELIGDLPAAGCVPAALSGVDDLVASILIIRVSAGQYHRGAMWRYASH
jgi:hypothetical protein